jgi:hypothetical protein
MKLHISNNHIAPRVLMELHVKKLKRLKNYFLKKLKILWVATLAIWPPPLAMLYHSLIIIHSPPGSNTTIDHLLILVSPSLKDELDIVIPTIRTWIFWRCGGHSSSPTTSSSSRTMTPPRPSRSQRGLTTSSTTAMT